MRVFENVVIAAALLVTVGAASGAEVPGGFIENSDDQVTRPVQTGISIPATRSSFTFPAPYGTTGVRITLPSDCGGDDCIWSGYSYWRQMSNHVGEDIMYIYVRTNPAKGGVGPSLYSYQKSTDEVINMGAIFSNPSPGVETHLSNSFGEGWYFSGTRPHTIYAFIRTFDSPKLFRYDFVTKTLEEVFDATEHLGTGIYIWQPHSSDDDNVHSVTIKRSSDDELLGCLVYLEKLDEYRYFPKLGAYDECQVDRSGQYLLIKDDVDLSGGEDNRIIDLVAGTERTLWDAEGAGGHSDNGYGYMIADDNQLSHGTKRLWKFDFPEVNGTILAHGNGSGIASQLSHTNAKPLSVSAIEHQFACGSQVKPSGNARSNELLCFRLDGSKDLLIVAPTMATSGEPQATLDVTGDYMIWQSNNGGNADHIFLVKVPHHLLADANSNPSQPTFGLEPVAWTNLLNASVSGSSIEDNGCECGNSGGQSSQEIISGDGFVEFSASGFSMRGIGLDSGQYGYTYGDIDFAIVFWPTGNAEIRENGSYKGDFSYVSGERFRIAIEDGDVNYYRITGSGPVIVSSNTSANVQYPLRLSVALHEDLSSIGDAEISAEAGDDPDPPPSGDVTWTAVSHANVTGNSIMDAGCQCGDAGGVSVESIVSGDGHIEFTVDELSMRGIGLSSGAFGNVYADIDYALVFWPTGNVEIRESGAYKGDFSYAAGDRLRIAVDQGAVKYYKYVQGTLTLVHSTSAPSINYPLVAAAALHQTGSSVSNVVLVDE